MLYDNALLARAYLHGFQVSGEPFFARVCTETLDWALRDLRQDGGRLRLRARRRLRGRGGALLRLDARRGARGARRRASPRRRSRYFGLDGPPNFEGRWAPVRATRDPERLDEIKARLRAAREQRVWPALDDKRLTAWNALMISALADAGAALERAGLHATPRSRARSSSGATCATPTGRLLRTYNRGQARLGAYLEDHAFLLEALLTLYEATFDPRWFAAARELADTILARFADAEHGGFFATADDHEELVARRKELEDAPIPAGASAAAFGLLRLAALTGERRYEEAALGVLRLLHVVAPQHPRAFGHVLQALDFHFAAVKEVAIVGPDAAPLERVVRGAFRPHLVVAGGPADGVPLLEGREPVDGRAAAYVCERFACMRPVTEPGRARGAALRPGADGESFVAPGQHAAAHELRGLRRADRPRVHPADRPGRVTRSRTTAPLRSCEPFRRLSSDRLRAFFLTLTVLRFSLQPGPWHVSFTRVALRDGLDGQRRELRVADRRTWPEAGDACGRAADSRASRPLQSWSIRSPGLSDGAGRIAAIGVVAVGRPLHAVAVGVEVGGGGGGGAGTACVLRRIVSRPRLVVRRRRGRAGVCRRSRRRATP